MVKLDSFRSCLVSVFHAMLETRNFIISFFPHFLQPQMKVGLCLS